MVRRGGTRTGRLSRSAGRSAAATPAEHRRGRRGRSAGPLTSPVVRRPGSTERGVDPGLWLGYALDRGSVKGALMSTPDSATTNAADQQDGKKLSAKTNVLNWGLGREFNITLIAALLSLVVALVTSLISSRIAAGNTRRELQRDQERTAITRLEIAQLQGDRRNYWRGRGRTTSKIRGTRGNP